MHVYFYVIPTFKQYLFLAKGVCVFYRSTSPVSGVFPLAMQQINKINNKQSAIEPNNAGTYIIHKYLQVTLISTFKYYVLASA